MQFRIVPVSAQDSRFEVVDHQPPRNSAEVLKGVLQRRDEVVGCLTPDGLTVAFARVAEHDAEHPRASHLALRVIHWRSRAKVDLSFLARRGFQPANWQRSLGPKLGRQPPDAVVAAAIAVVRSQILKDPLRRQALL